MSTTSVTFRTEESNRDRLDEIAESMDRNRNWVINQAIENYMEQYDWELKEIDAGLADIKAGRTVSGEEVRAEFERKFRAAAAKKLRAKKTV